MRVTNRIVECLIVLFLQADHEQLSVADEEVRKKGEYAKWKGIAGVSAESMGTTMKNNFLRANELFKAFRGEITQI
jgi:hypothetical protein